MMQIVDEAFIVPLTSSISHMHKLVTFFGNLMYKCKQIFHKQNSDNLNILQSRWEFQFAFNRSSYFSV